MLFSVRMTEWVKQRASQKDKESIPDNCISLFLYKQIIAASRMYDSAQHISLCQVFHYQNMNVGAKRN